MLRLILPPVVLMAALLALAPAAEAKTFCEPSNAYDKRVRITILRGTTCRRANEATAVYLERRYRVPYRFMCVLTHNDPKYAIACGAGRRGSNVRNWRRAFLVRILSAR
jgi:hypothetical protein